MKTGKRSKRSKFRNEDENEAEKSESKETQSGKKPFAAHRNSAQKRPLTRFTFPSRFVTVPPAKPVQSKAAGFSVYLTEIVNPLFAGPVIR